MNGKRYSRQRELIYQTLCRTDEHPTAEMVYRWLKPENPSLSLGTVYRNLNLLADEGVIRRMAFPVERYDERFTSRIAARDLAASGMPKSRRQEKGLLDRTSAALILRDYMESRHR